MKTDLCGFMFQVAGKLATRSMVWRPLLQRSVVLCLLTSSVTAYSKTIEWEEEAPLNNGDVVWVKRAIVYARGSEPGNPFVPAWISKETSLSFHWRGKRYSYGGSAMVVAVDSNNRINIFRFLGPSDIYQGGMKCRRPSYVQLREEGGTWSVLPSVEPWAYNLPRNQMISVEHDNAPAKVSSELRLERDRGNAFFVQHPPNRFIDPTYVSTECKGKV